MSIAWWLFGGSAALIAYTFVGYPLALKLLGVQRPGRRLPDRTSDQWPVVTITLAAYNEAASIGATLESLLALDYPRARRQILVVSDASTDRTDEIVAGYAGRGVELLRLPQRGGKTAAENAARSHLRGEIVVNTDASVRVPPSSLKPLVAAFADPTVGVASGHDVSLAGREPADNAAEGGYVGYEMWVRALETRVDGIVGASGCFYAVRAGLHRVAVPEFLSRDFAAALIARERGYRAVSVPEAVCYVPWTGSLRHEYRRKVRTITRGLATLLAKRRLLDPFRYGVFAWMLFSHKLCRWLAPVALVMAVGALGGLTASHAWARWLLGAALLGGALVAAGWRWADDPGDRERKRTWRRGLGLVAWVAMSQVAVLRAWRLAVQGRLFPIWEPTRREAVESG